MPARTPRDLEPSLWRGEWQTPAAGHHSFPPRIRSRFDAPPRRCPHCELVAQTSEPTCPVCAAPYFSTWWARLRALLRGE